MDEKILGGGGQNGSGQEFVKRLDLRLDCKALGRVANLFKTTCLSAAKSLKKFFSPRNFTQHTIIFLEAFNCQSVKMKLRHYFKHAGRKALKIKSFMKENIDS